MHLTDSPTTASLMGYRGVVKPATVRNSIVMKRLNAQRGERLALSGISRSTRYFNGILLTESGTLTNA